MRRHMGVMAALMVLLAAGWAYADYDMAFGEVKSVDAEGMKIVVAVRQGGRDAEAKDVTYAVDKDATIKVNNEKKALKDVEVGKRVTIVFKEGDTPTAILITVREMRRGGGN